jgi:putative nucleotidyltransferase with HDIG domain
MAEKLIDAASELVARVLEENPERLHHSAAVAARSRELAITVALSEVDTLVAAAWLHDIGYSSRTRETGFHPLDGAQYLRRGGWPEGVCALVAHHSGSRFVARVLGLDDRLREFEFVEDPLSDALTVPGQTPPDRTGRSWRWTNAYARSAGDTRPTHRTPAPTPSGTTTFAPPPGGWRVASPSWIDPTATWGMAMNHPAIAASRRGSGPAPVRRRLLPRPAGQARIALDRSVDRSGSEKSPLRQRAQQFPWCQ